MANLEFRALTAYLDSMEQNLHVPAYELIIMKEHKELYHYRRGCGDRGIYWFYSSTKLFTITAALRLVERGVIALDEPVSRYIPEFAELTVNEGGTIRPAKTVMTIGHLFSMMGGLSYDTTATAITTSTDRSTVGLVRQMAKAPLLFDPGEGFEYSLCHDVLAAVVELASGRRFGEYIEKEIAAPLGMKDITFHPDDAIMARMLPQCIIQGDKAIEIPFDNMYRLSPEYESGGAGLCGTAEDYVLLPDALANGGMGQSGYQLLRSETVALMAENKLNNKLLSKMHAIWPRNRSYGYALGVRTRMNNSDNGKAPVGEFGWDGAAGCYSVIDPVNRLAMFYVQHVLGHNDAFEQIHHTVRDYMYEE